MNKLLKEKKKRTKNCREKRFSLVEEIDII